MRYGAVRNSSSERPQHARSRTVYAPLLALACVLAREGIATAVVGVPNRYMHSPNEMVSLDDLDQAATLIAETCRAVDGATDFTAR